MSQAALRVFDQPAAVELRLSRDASPNLRETDKVGGWKAKEIKQFVSPERADLIDRSKRGELSRDEKGFLKFDQLQGDINAIITKVINTFAVSCPFKGELCVNETKAVLQEAGYKVSDQAVLNFLDKARAAIEDKVKFAIRLALDEILSNHAVYGNHGDPALKVEVAWGLANKGGPLTIEAKDQGNGFDPASVPDPTRDENLEKNCGRGIYLAKAYSDLFETLPPGNHTRMVFGYRNTLEMMIRGGDLKSQLAELK